MRKKVDDIIKALDVQVNNGKKVVNLKEVYGKKKKLPTDVQPIN